MGYPRGDRWAARKAAQDDARYRNAWIECPKHGGYNPYRKHFGTWEHQECPGCQRARYEAWKAEDAAATTNGHPDPSASA